MDRDRRDDDDVTQPTQPVDARAATGGLHSMRYRLGAVIGRGGQGEVLSAVDTQIDREVAIKRMTAAYPSQRAMGRFFREASIQGRLDHPAIVPVHELGVDADGRPYFAMKKLAGTTLARKLRDGVARAPLLRAFVEVCLAVEYAHARGIVHRDLKPDNIVLGDFGEVYVLDWGVAKRLGDAGDSASDRDRDSDSDSDRDRDRDGDRGDDVDTEEALEPMATAAGTAIGTLAYMSPEQSADPRAVDARADVYALGCILYEILAGEPLFGTLASNLDLPPELDALWRAATAADRAARTATARELGDAVQRYLDGDRDIAVRRDLGRAHLDAARVAARDGDRRAALHAAGRALVLDPTADAATFVGSLMIDRPRELPPEVARAVADHDDATVRAMIRANKWASLGFLWLLPAIGFMFASRPGWALAMLAAPAAVSVVAFGVPPGRLHTVAVVASNALLVGVLAHVFSPPLFAPLFAATAAMLIASNPLVTSWRGTLAAAGALGGAILATWGLDALVASPGAPPAIAATRGTLALTAPGFDVPPTVTYLVLAAWIAVTVVAIAALGHARRRAEVRARTELELGAWQLRQLFPA
jgi:serine/threonine-protein kinase|nr:serine/threonine-protein kinase [Kofleriaceae bacterium]